MISCVLEGWDDMSHQLSSIMGMKFLDTTGYMKLILL